MELTKARAIAEELKALLGGGCEKIEIAGSIRRRKPFPNDIELLAIPKFNGLADLLDQEIQTLLFEGVLDFRLNKKGSRAYGPKNKLMVHKPSGIGVDIFSTTRENWPVSLVVRTGGEKTNRRIATAAINKGLHFHAYGRGFTGRQGEVICRSEQDVFTAVNLPYREPWERD